MHNSQRSSLLIPDLAFGLRRHRLSFPAPRENCIAETTNDLVTLEYDTILNSEGVV